MAQKTLPVWTYSLPSALLLMAPFDLLASLAMDIYLPVIPQMPSALATSTAIVQLTLSIYMIVLGLGQLLFGPLSDRIGRRPVVLCGAALFSASSLALALTSDGLVFVVLRLLQALGASAALVATFATVRDVYADGPDGSTIYGLFGAMLAFVPALGPVAGALIAVNLGWRAIFATLALLGLLAFAQALLRWHETRPQQQGYAGVNVRRVFSSAAFWIYTLGFSTAMGVFFVFFSTAPRVLMGIVGISQLAFSGIFASVAVVMIVTARFSKYIVPRWGIEGCLIRGLCVIFFGASLLAACTYFLGFSAVSFVLPMWVIAVGMVFLVSVTANGALQEFGDAAGTAVALYYCVQSLIVGVVGTMLIVVLPGDSAWPLVGYCLLLASATLIALLLGRAHAKNQEEEGRGRF